jgi:hypothetical protein
MMPPRDPTGTRAVMSRRAITGVRRGEREAEHRDRGKRSDQEERTGKH